MEYSFERLWAYQSARKLVREVYNLLRKFPNEERFALCDQIRRAIISVPSNIAEQSGRTSFKERIHFLDIAYGSLMEAYCQLEISFDLGYITYDDLSKIKNLFFDTSRLLIGLKKNLVSQPSAEEGRVKRLKG